MQQRYPLILQVKLWIDDITVPEYIVEIESDEKNKESKPINTENYVGNLWKQYRKTIEMATQALGLSHDLRFLPLQSY